jgi:hypothetical protein
MLAVAARFAPKGVRCSSVYLSEAHGADAWSVRSSRFVPTGEVIDVDQTHTLEARFEAAKQWEEMFAMGWPLRLDVPPCNAFNTAFAAWPTRISILVDGRLVYVSRIHDASISTYEACEELERLLLA